MNIYIYILKTWQVTFQYVGHRHLSKSSFSISMLSHHIPYQKLCQYGHVTNHVKSILMYLRTMIRYWKFIIWRKLEIYSWNSSNVITYYRMLYFWILFVSWSFLFCMWLIIDSQTCCNNFIVTCNVLSCFKWQIPIRS